MSDPRNREAERARTAAWMDGLDDVIARDGVDAARRLLAQMFGRAATQGVTLPFQRTAPPVNTIAAADQPAFPGDLDLERRLEALVCWNAAATVVRANRRLSGIGGHIGTYLSAATLFEVGFNHAFHADDAVFVQGHASTGIYARAFLEGRLSRAQMDNFRRELVESGGLPSYPHPWLMPDFWSHPTVSMGLATLQAIYHARFEHYLAARGLVDAPRRVWAVVGDGEMDEPESVAGLERAARERLGNLTVVIDCNLQRLDGPVRGNGHVIDELEARFAAAGWQVLVVRWGGEWDPLFEQDVDGRLVERLGEVVDGDWQRYVVEGGAFFREHFFQRAGLGARVEHLTDAQLEGLRRGGHDPEKVYAAYRAAMDDEERPSVILAHTIKGYRLGSVGEALNVAHKVKTLDADALRAFRDRLGVPIGDDDVGDAPLVRPAEDSPEIEYLRARREALGGPAPRRRVRAAPLESPPAAVFERWTEGTGEREATTTVALVRLLSDLLNDETLGPLLVPIVPDEARTFGIEALFPKIGIYAPGGQRYEPVDADTLQPYEPPHIILRVAVHRSARRCRRCEALAILGVLLRHSTLASARSPAPRSVRTLWGSSYAERADGQLLEEGISEAGAMASFIAAGTAYAHRGLNTIPLYFFYSMFGFQRVGDLIWAAGDARARGFLIGCTSGRTTLNGEGLQHQDGHSHLLAHGFPAVRAYDPAFAYEVATLVRAGIERLFVEGHDETWYLTVANAPYQHPPRSDGAEEGIVRGLYRARASQKSGEVRRAQLLASGPIVVEAFEALRILEEDYGVTADVWSVTSWQQLYRDAVACERHDRLHPDADARVPWLAQCLGEDAGVIVAVSDFVKALPHALARWMPGPLVALGTDGFGRSDSRPALRRFFQIDARHIAHAALSGLARAGRYPMASALRAADELGVDAEARPPFVAGEGET